MMKNYGFFYLNLISIIILEFIMKLFKQHMKNIIKMNIEKI